MYYKFIDPEHFIYELSPMKTFLYRVILLSLCSCTTPQKILKNSISYHDPDNRWNSFQGTISLKSNFGEQPEIIDISLNNPTKTVIYDNQTTEVKAIFSDTSCVIENGDRSYDELSWTRNFYHFILGLPMTLNTSDARIGEELTTDTIGGKTSWRVKIDYEKEQWHFFFDKKTYQLNGFAFNKNFEKKAERIITEGTTKINGINFVNQRTWWITTDTLHPTLGGVDRIILSK